MKKFTLILLGSLCLSTMAMAVEIPDLSQDRIEVAPGVIGITHTENFEYVCKTEADENGGKVVFNTYVDINFSEKAPFRLAAGFVGGGKVMGMIAAEANIVSFARGRCPGLCLSLTIESEDKSTVMVNFQENPISKEIIMLEIENGGKPDRVGTCTKNEVE